MFPDAAEVLVDMRTFPAVPAAVPPATLISPDNILETPVLKLALPETAFDCPVPVAKLIVPDTIPFPLVAVTAPPFSVDSLA